ncbi:UNVERIFIED_CONTAM: putative inactive purple acid phosphatase 27 [Sesamum indicum]
MPTAAFRVFRFFMLVFIIIVKTSSSSLSESLLRSTIHLRNHTAISEFRLVNRRHLINCPGNNPFLQVNISSVDGHTTLSDDEYVTVNITGVLLPSTGDWVAMISPSHSKDYVDSGSVYITPDSGGECGVPYETYFPMPTAAQDKPWYSIEQGSVHFTVISTEHNWSVNSEQYEWMNKDMAAVDRTTTPWLIFAGHRPMYTSSPGLPILPSVDRDFVDAVEPLLLANKVDLALFGHVHNYERTCAVYQQECKAMPTKDRNGVDTYNNANYSAPVHAVIGMAGFTLDSFSTNDNSWSLCRISQFGYIRAHATKEELIVEFIDAESRKVDDSFRITRYS